MRSTHSQRIENYLGTDKVYELSQNMRGWYGPPIALDVPGKVYLTGDGDFIGDISEGGEVTFMDRAEDLLRRFNRAARAAHGDSKNQLNVGFASLTALINNAKYNGKLQTLRFDKAFASGGSTTWSDSFSIARIPGNSAIAGAAPGGAACNSTTTGGHTEFRNAPAGETQHLGPCDTNAILTAGFSLLIYDRLFQVLKANNTTNEAVTGVPTRYQNTSLSAADSASGNFVIPVAASSYTGTAHNLNAVYTNQSGSTGAVMPQVTGSTLSLPAGSIDTSALAHPWFMPLAAGDTGILALTEIDQSIALAGGQVAFVIGHPLGWCANPVTRMTTRNLGLATAFSLTRVFDDACICMIASGGTSDVIGALQIIST